MIPTSALTNDSLAEMLELVAVQNSNYLGPTTQQIIIEAADRLGREPKIVCDECGADFPLHKHLCQDCTNKHLHGLVGWIARKLKRVVPAAATCKACGVPLFLLDFSSWYWRH